MGHFKLTKDGHLDQRAHQDFKKDELVATSKELTKYPNLKSADKDHQRKAGSQSKSIAPHDVRRIRYYFAQAVTNEDFICITSNLIDIASGRVQGSTTQDQINASKYILDRLMGKIPTAQVDIATDKEMPNIKITLVD